jgi:hypothetical protein
MPNFLKLLINATSQESSKRFAVVSLILVLIVVNVVLIFIVVSLVIKLLPVPQYIADQIFITWRQVLEGNLFLVSFGIGATVVTAGGSILQTIFSKKYDVQQTVAETGTPGTVVQVQDNENVNVKGEKVDVKKQSKEGSSEEAIDL